MVDAPILPPVVGRILRPAALDTPLRPAIFLDRDGTLMEEVPYPRDPAVVKLLPGAAEAMQKLAAAGYALVIVSNQSGIGRGRITVEEAASVEREFCRQMAEGGVTFDALYHCPLAPRTADKTTIDDEYRKPGPGMLRRAATDLRLDLASSWIIGDKVSDTLAGQHAGCRGGIVVLTGMPVSEEDKHHPSVTLVAADVAQAADRILHFRNESLSDATAT